MLLQRFFAGLSVAAGLMSGSVARAQEVFVTKTAKEATVKIYATSYKAEADVIVFKTPFSKNAVGNKGIWHFNKCSAPADKRIYFSEKLNADLIVFFTDNSFEAGWRNKKKRYLMR